MFLGGCALEAVSLLWRNEYKEAKEEEESTEEEEMIESTENFNVSTIIIIVYSRSGRRATRIQF